MHQNRKHKNCEAIAVFVKDLYSFKKEMILALSEKRLIDILSTEITNNESKTFIYNVVYLPPDGYIDVCENYFKNIFFKNNVISKNILLAEDFKINLLHFQQNKVQNFINLIFQLGLVPTTNKPTIIKKDTTSAIDHMIKNSIIIKRIENRKSFQIQITQNFVENSKKY